jgi:nitronate monooxygenase
MLEAERAGAKALVVFMDEHPRASEAWKLLRGIQNDETHNCALIGELLKRAGAPYSHATGEFYDKAVAVTGRRERIEFLARGLRWAVKRFEEALPTLPEEARDLVTRMRDSHLRSIAACEALARKLPR